MGRDEDLMQAYVRGDRAAFRALFDHYHPILSRLLRRDIARSQDVEDVLQQTFLQLHRARKDYQPNRPLRPWLLTIAFNVKRQLFRSRSRKPTESIDDNTAADIAGSAAPATGPDSLGVRQALLQLPELQRDTIVLHYFEGLSFSEVSQITGGTVSAAKVRAHRGYQRLRELLGDADTERALAHNVA